MRFPCDFRQALAFLVGLSPFFRPIQRSSCIIARKNRTAHLPVNQLVFSKIGFGGGRQGTHLHHLGKPGTPASDELWVNRLCNQRYIVRIQRSESPKLQTAYVRRLVGGRQRAANTAALLLSLVGKETTFLRRYPSPTCGRLPPHSVLYAGMTTISLFQLQATLAHNCNRQKQIEENNNTHNSTASIHTISLLLKTARVLRANPEPLLIARLVFNRKLLSRVVCMPQSDEYTPFLAAVVPKTATTRR